MLLLVNNRLLFVATIIDVEIMYILIYISKLMYLQKMCARRIENAIGKYFSHDNSSLSRHIFCLRDLKPQGSYYTKSEHR